MNYSATFPQEDVMIDLRKFCLFVESLFEKSPALFLTDFTTLYGIHLVEFKRDIKTESFRIEM